jgi:hypothetical protein
MCADSANNQGDGCAWETPFLKSEILDPPLANQILLLHISVHEDDACNIMRARIAGLTIRYVLVHGSPNCCGLVVTDCPCLRIPEYCGICESKENE